MRCMKDDVLKISLLILVACLCSCSLWQQGRVPSAFQDSDGQEGFESVEFNAFHNIRPTRQSGGGYYQIDFMSPKNLREISFEFVNHKVKIHDVILIKASGKNFAVRGFRSRFLSPDQKHLSLRNLARAKNIQSVKFKAEGYESDDVLFTVSFFSPDGFLPQEQGRAVALKNLNSSYPLLVTEKLPACLLQNPELSHVVFDSKQLRELSNSEKRYFCRHFVPRLEEFIHQHESASQFLRTGENLEKPLVSLGGGFSYDSYENHLVFPFRLRKEQFPSMAKRLESYYERPKGKASRGLSQEVDNRYALQQSYEEYMNQASSPELHYLEAQGSKGQLEHQRECLERMIELGIHSTQAKKHCRDAIGNELKHVACVEFLTDQYVLSGNAHHYCLEANGKLQHYKPCMQKLLSLDMNHYDSNLFCQKTPSGYMQDQLLCVDEMVRSGESKYKSVKACQNNWGKEDQLLRCVSDQGHERCGVR